jgi:hypothetical protein
MKYRNRLYVHKIKKFQTLMENTCKRFNINSDFNSFINYGFNGFCSETYKYLFLLPKSYLCNSKVFIKYWHKLDQDFREDLMTYDEIKELRKDIKSDKQYLAYLKKVMGSDSLL